MHSPTSDGGSEDTHAVKRRKVRKGTHSCWACKRRKEKCIHRHGNAVCVGCQHRGTSCVSQEFAEQEEKQQQKSEGISLDQRLASIESLLARVVRNDVPKDDYHCARASDKDSPAHSPQQISNSGLPPSVSENINNESNSVEDASPWTTRRLPSEKVQLKFPVDRTHRLPDGVTQLSLLLHQALQIPSDYSILFGELLEDNMSAVCAIARLTTSPASLQDDHFALSHAMMHFRRPDGGSHPILLARHMLVLATFLLQLPTAGNKRYLAAINGLSQTPRAMAEDLMSAVSHLVLGREELHDNLESLHCLMLATLYYSIHGDLRRSWITSRKALLLAQLFALDQPTRVHKQIPVLDANQRLDAQVMWTQIVFYDRHLCLLLGLSQGSTDRAMASGPAFEQDTPTGRLERIHSDVASQIIQRNCSTQKSASSASDSSPTTTQLLDSQLLCAARSMPSSWWRIATAPRSFSDLRALGAQMFHYSLLNQVHLPYMLRTDSTYAYSRGVCVNAAREMLSRYSVLRKVSAAGSSCRVIDFLALMAAMTLLLCHLYVRHSGTDGLLAHQYPSDRCLIEEAQEHAESAARSDDRDWISRRSAHVLRQLLAVDDEIVKEQVTHTHRVTVHSGEDVAKDAADDSAIHVHIPYFGVINIARDHVTAAPDIPLSANFLPPHTMVDVQPLATHDLTLSSDWQQQDLPFDTQTNGSYNDLSLNPTTLPTEDQWTFEGFNIAFFGDLLGGNS